MHKRIIMLAKIALIIAAAQLHITTTNFISTQTNASNAIYAMSNDEEPTIFQAFKNEIESTVQLQSKTLLSNEGTKQLKETIQAFIDNDEEIALALYIANKWGIINELGWKIDAVTNYVQSCLSNLYNLTKTDNTIQIKNAEHRDIAKAINKLRIISAAATNKLRIKLINILTPTRVISSQNQTKADTQTDREAIKELNPEEEKLIQLICNVCPEIYQTKNTQQNQNLKELYNLLDQLQLIYCTYNPQTPLTWFLRNAHLNYEPDGLRGRNSSPQMNLIETLYLYQPELLLSLHLIDNIGLTNTPAHFTDKQAEEFEEIIECLKEDGTTFTISEELEEGKYNTQLPLIQQIYEEINTANNNYNEKHSIDQQLMGRFLAFLICLPITETIQNYNHSTIFQRVEETSQQAAHQNISITLTQTQTELLTKLAKAYKEAEERLPEGQNWLLYAKKWFSVQHEIIQTVLDTVSNKENIEARQIANELARHKKELQLEEAKYKKQEAIEATCIATLDKSTNDLAQLLQIEKTQTNAEQLLYEIGQQLHQIQNNDQQKTNYFQQLYAKSDTISNEANLQAKTTSISVENNNKATTLKKKLKLIDNNLKSLNEHTRDLKNIDTNATTEQLPGRQAIIERCEQIQQLYGIVKEIISEEAKSIQEKERVEKIEKLMKKVKEHLEQNQGSNSQIPTTQKIINNLNATNNMLQIINLILY